ncbi:GntR family transcriptional regulator [Paraburkholderia aromaticivorans]|uniref:GntR family transcriptional regulator n=1 Tax=Paraburkholderia aromaticivorans TaxID=2026199 RepID=UPI001F0FE6E5|nr:GntR family transcriptional regulator [Paraburkholderia aromaticivorans]
MERIAAHDDHSGVGPHLGRGADDSSPFKGGMGKLQLSEAVAMHLREQIISGKLSSGEFLRIDAIASELGVSSTPVREGLLLLQSESIVRLIPRRGFVVVGLRREDLLDLFWAQATIGAELAARAAVHMTQEDIAALQDLDAQHQRAVASGQDALAARLGHLFHRKINLSAQSARLAQLLGNLTRQLPNWFYASIEGQLQGAVDYHPIIVNAIRVHDAESARSLMFRHILSGGEHMVATFDRQHTSSQAEQKSAAE